MLSQRIGGSSTVTQVKVLSPERYHVASGQGILPLEASIAARVKGECDGGEPGSKATVGDPTARVGTWEGHVVPGTSFQQAEEARRKYGGMAVGLTHSRGVAGVMPGASPSSLEGVSGKAQRVQVAHAIH